MKKLLRAYKQTKKKKKQKTTVNAKPSTNIYRGGRDNLSISSVVGSHELYLYSSQKEKASRLVIRGKDFDSRNPSMGMHA